MAYIAVFFALFCGVYLFYKSHAFAYYVKLFYFQASGFLSSFILLFFCFLHPRDVGNIRRYASTLWPFLWQPLNVEMELRGEENLKSNSPCIVLSNHQSSLDMLPMLTYIPERCTALAKKELLYAGAFGLAAWLSEVIFIDRLNPDSARTTMDKTVQTLLQKNLKVWIFPEGTRFLGDTLLPFKKGAFHLAIQAKVPVVPIVFSSYQHFLNPKKKYFTPGKIIVTALPPVPTEHLTTADVTALTDNVREMMVAEFKKTTQEVNHWARDNGYNAVLDIIEQKAE